VEIMLKWPAMVSLGEKTSSGQNLYPSDECGLCCIPGIEDLRFHSTQETLWPSGCNLHSEVGGYQDLTEAHSFHPDADRSQPSGMATIKDTSPVTSISGSSPPF
jgi:hypothetical protein